jgi:protein AbiQ
MKLKFYEVNQEYQSYLKQFETKIMDSKGIKEKRPYIGIIIQIEEYSYFAPLTSPKPKHLKLKNSMDFLKIDGGVLGAINFNNMIPVKADLFTEKDIEAETDENYKNLLKKQLTWCNTTTNKDNIIKKAEKLYKEITTKKEKSRLWERCCNFSLLEEKALEYSQVLEVKKNDNK